MHNVSAKRRAARRGAAPQVNLAAEAAGRATSYELRPYVLPLAPGLALRVHEFHARDSVWESPGFRVFGVQSACRDVRSTRKDEV